MNPLVQISALALLLSPGLVAAGSDKPSGPTQVHTNVNVHPKVRVGGAPSRNTAESASNARTGASTSRATAGRSDAAVVDESISDDHSVVVYEAERAAASSAAGLPEAYCGGAGLSAQARGVGLSVTDRDYVCARLALATSKRETGLAYLAAAADLPEGRAGEIMRLGVELIAEGRLEEMKASARLDEDDTRMRRLFVTVFGSLPRPLSYLAPR